MHESLLQNVETPSVQIVKFIIQNQDGELLMTNFVAKTLFYATSV